MPEIAKTCAEAWLQYTIQNPAMLDTKSQAAFEAGWLALDLAIRPILIDIRKEMRRLKSKL